MNRIYTGTYLLATLFFTAYSYLMPPQGHDYDMGCFAQWAVYIFNHGLGEAYDSGTNYLPGHLFEIRLYTLLFNNENDVLANIYYLKYFTLVFDIAGGLLLSSLAVSKNVQQLLLMALLLNPAYLHNNLIWGQFDSVFTCLAFASFLAFTRMKPAAGTALYIMSLNFKLQAIIFAPLMVAYVIYLFQPFTWKVFLKMAASAVIVQLLFLIPFIQSGSTLRVWNTLTGLAGTNGTISLEAANIWHLLMQGNLRWTSDNTLYQGIKLKNWGLIMYAAFTLIIMSPLLLNCIYRIKGKYRSISFEHFLLMFSLAPLGFFYFNTQMHERYSFPAFLFIAAYSFTSNKWWIYGLFSLAYFLNTDKLMQCITKINYHAECFEYRNISMIFLSVILLLIIALLRPLFSKKMFLKSDSTGMI